MIASIPPHPDLADRSPARQLSRADARTSFTDRKRSYHIIQGQRPFRKVKQPVNLPCGPRQPENLEESSRRLDEITTSRGLNGVFRSFRSIYFCVQRHFVPVNSGAALRVARPIYTKIRSIHIEQSIRTERKQKVYQILAGPNPWRVLFYPTSRIGQDQHDPKNWWKPRFWSYPADRCRSHPPEFVIRFVFRWAFRCLILSIVLIVGLLLLKDTIARSFAEQQIRRTTGFDAKVGKVRLGLIEPRIDIEGLVIYNPVEFGGSPLIDAPDIHVEYVPTELAARKVHLKFLRLNIREMNIVQNNGRTNLLEWASKAPTGAGDSRSSGGGYSFSGIDLLNLTVGKVRYTDMQHPKRSQEVQLKLENRLERNVRSPDEIVNLLLKEIFRTGITIYVDDRPRPKSAR